MDFAAEPVMDVFTPPPPRAAGRPVASADEAGPTFDDHLEAASETPANEAPTAPAQDSKPSIDGKPEATPQPDPADAALLGAPTPTSLEPPIAAPVAVQIAASSPVQSRQQQQPAPAAPPIDGAMTAPPTQPARQDAAPHGVPAPIAPTKSAAAPGGASAPAKTPATAPAPTAPQSTAAPLAQTPAQQAGPQTPIQVESLPSEARAAVAISPAAAEAVQQAAQRTLKPGPDAGQTKRTPEAANAKGAPKAPLHVAARAPTNLVPAAPGVVNDASAPALPTISDLAQSPQALTTTAAAAQASTHVQHAANDAGAQRAAPAAAQVAREIIRRSDGGATSFELRLDPPELGRVEVRMEVSRDHRVTAVIAADSPQALTELARHARELEQQLQSAGLQLSDNGLSFDLRQGAQGGDAQDADGAARGGGGGEDANLEQAQAPAARPIGFERWRGVRVDMMV